MTDTIIKASRQAARGQSGFSLIEVLVCVAVLTVVSATAMSGVMNLTKTSGTINNRTEMHAGVRNATELLQQEVGQAGRITLPAGITLTSSPAVKDTTFTVSSVTGIFVGEYLTIGTGGNMACTQGCEETIKVNAIIGNQITIEPNAALTKGHIDFGTHTRGRAHSHFGRLCLRRRADRRNQSWRHDQCGQRLNRNASENLRRHQWRRQHGLHRVPV